MGSEPRLPSFLRDSGFCAALPGECLANLFTYTLEVSRKGLPPVAAKFWRRLALAVPPNQALRSATPYNITSLSLWLAQQVEEQGRKGAAARDKAMAQTLLLFVKGLALTPPPAADASRERRRSANGQIAKSARVIQVLQREAPRGAAVEVAGNRDASGRKQKVLVPRLDLKILHHASV